MSLNIIEQAALVLIVLAIIFGLIRLLIGPEPADRIVAADTLAVITTAGLTGFAAWFANPVYLDVALVYSLLMAMGSVEARIDLGASFELALFYDIGRISDTFGASHDTAGWRSTTGAGIRYITPVGPIGFLYGFKLDPREDESSGRLHFSIGYTF